METRVKIFEGDKLNDIELSANNFLKNMNGHLHDVQYLCDQGKIYDKFSVLMVYTEEKNEEKVCDSKKNEEGHGRIPGRITPLWIEGGPDRKV